MYSLTLKYNYQNQVVQTHFSANISKTNLVVAFVLLKAVLTSNRLHPIAMLFPVCNISFRMFFVSLCFGQISKPGTH